MDYVTVSSLYNNSDITANVTQQSSNNLFIPSDPSDDILLLQNVVRCLQLYAAPVISISGILCNVMCFIILHRCERGYPVLASALIAAETLQLMGLLHEWATELGMNLYVMTGWCNFQMLLHDESRFLSQWYHVMLTLHCLLYTCCPDRTNNRTRHSLIPVALLAIIALVVYLNICLTASLFYIMERPVCTYITAPRSALFYLQTIDVFLNTFLPLFINSATCIAIAALLISCSICYNEIQYKNNANFTKYVLSHNLLWMPLQIAVIHNTISKLSYDFSQVSLRNFLWEQILQYMLYINFSLSFLVLIAADNVFRNKIKEFILKHRCCAQARPSESGYSSDIVVHCDQAEDEL